MGGSSEWNNNIEGGLELVDVLIRKGEKGLGVGLGDVRYV